MLEEIPPAPDVRVRGFSNKIAVTSADRDAAYRIRYEAYATAGHIDINSEHRFHDEYDRQPNCFTYLLHEDSTPIGSVRACVYTGAPGWHEIPAMKLFRSEIVSAVGLGSRFVELNRLVLLPDVRSRTRAVKLALFNNAVVAADTFSCRFMLAAVREEHLSFYKLLEFTPISEAKPYHGVKFTTVLMAMNWEEAAPRLRKHEIFKRVEDFPVFWHRPADGKTGAHI